VQVYLDHQLIYTAPTGRYYIDRTFNVSQGTHILTVEGMGCGRSVLAQRRALPWALTYLNFGRRIAHYIVQLAFRVNCITVYICFAVFQVNWPIAEHAVNC